MPAKETRISVESLRPVAVLYEGDIYELARLVLKLLDATDREKNSHNTQSVVRTRPSVNGLAMYYSLLVSDVTAERVKQVLVQHGLPLGAIVDNEAVSTSLRQGNRTSRRQRGRKPSGE